MLGVSVSDIDSTSDLHFQRTRPGKKRRIALRKQAQKLKREKRTSGEDSAGEDRSREGEEDTSKSRKEGKEESQREGKKSRVGCW